MAEDRLLRWLAKLSAALAEERVPHAVAGGLAVAAWAEPRATVDIDLVVRPDEEAVAAARRACRAAGLLQTGRQIIAFRRLRMLRMLVPPEEDEPTSVDLLLLHEDLAADVLRRARALPLESRSLPTVSPEDLILLKLLRSSEQDRVDIRAIARACRLDRPYLERWARRLRILTRLRSAGLR